MSVRSSSLLVLGLVLAALGIGAFVRASRAPLPAASPASEPGVSRAAAPSAPPAAAAPVRRPRLLVAPPPEKDDSLSEWRRMRERLGEAHAKALASGGPRAAYSLLLARLDGVPADEQARRDRVYAFRYLPAIAAAEPLLKPEILARLRRHLTDDRDPDARRAAAATFADAPLFFTQVDEETAYFWTAGTLLPPGAEGADEQRLRPEGPPDAEARAVLRSAFGVEASADVRMSLMELLAAEATAGERGFFQAALQSDADAQVRELSLNALSRMPWSPESRQALGQALQGDPAPEVRRVALATLVRQGAVDDLVVSRLLEAPPTSREGWDLMAKAWAVSQAPALGGFLRSSLDSTDPLRRSGGLAAMAKSGDRAFLPFMEAMLARESDASVRDLGARAVKMLASSSP